MDCLCGKYVERKVKARSGLLANTVCGNCGRDTLRHVLIKRVSQLEREKAILKEDFAGLQGRIEQVVEEYEAECEGLNEHCADQDTALLESVDTFNYQKDEIARLTSNQRAPDCVWRPVKDWDMPAHETSCGETWCITEGSVEDNNVRFCQGCGGKVTVEEV